VTVKDLEKAYIGYETYDEDEADRVEHIAMYVWPSWTRSVLHNILRSYSLKSKGKGAPKKRRTYEGLSSPLVLMEPQLTGFRRVKEVQSHEEQGRRWFIELDIECWSSGLYGIHSALKALHESNELPSTLGLLKLLHDLACTEGSSFV